MATWSDGKQSIVGHNIGDLWMHPQMIPAGVTCLEAVTSICDRWGQQVPAKVSATLIQVKITLFGNFIKGTYEFSRA